MNSKAQAWYMDFSIALLLFIFTFIIYSSYTHNFQKEDKGELDLLITDAKSISSSLTLRGYPNNWNNETVIRIGIADEQKINTTKLKYFKQLNYSKTKKNFGTIFDYFVFFTNEKGEVLNINGVCGAGHPLVNTTFNIRSAYYYQDPADSFLKAFMQDTFHSDIYFKDQTNDIYGLYGLISNLSKYSLVVFEHSLISGGDFNEYYRELNNYTARGGFFIVSGELATSGSGPDINGIRFWKKTGQSEPQRVAIVNNTDQHLILRIGDSMVFNQYYFVTNDTVLTIETDPNDEDYNPFPAIDFKILASYNKTPEDYAVASWKYGNGTVYFFSDFDVSNFAGDFLGLVEDAVKSLIEGTCTPVNTSLINPKKFVKIERYVEYNQKVVKMVVYLWQ